MTVIVSIFIWGLLIGGLLGPLLAIPLTATIKVLLARYVWGRAIARRSDREHRGGPRRPGSESRKLRTKPQRLVRQAMSRPSKRVRREDDAARFPGNSGCGLAALSSSPFFVVLGFGVGLFSFSSARKGWNRWHKGASLPRPTISSSTASFEAADALARKALAIDSNSIEASRILADATEKENDAETVAWRAQVARLDPGLDNQLNLASAALRFGQLDIARDALGRVDPADRDKAAYHVVAGWLSRAPGQCG